jgi:hypothetical protein
MPSPGEESGLTPEDLDALASILPGSTLFNSEFSFYLHICGLYKTASLTYHEVRASQLALSVTPPGMDTSELWCRIIKGYIDLGSYDEAYSNLAATPYEKVYVLIPFLMSFYKINDEPSKRECVTQLVNRMCEDDAVEKLVSFNFAGFHSEVENSLSFNARNADPRTRPFYSKILYTWYISRGDYRNGKFCYMVRGDLVFITLFPAALVMYQRARKIGSLLEDLTNFARLAELQLEAYAVSMNALSLLDQKTAWIAIPVVMETGFEVCFYKFTSPDHLRTDAY